MASLHDAMHAVNSANSMIWFYMWNRPQHGGYHGGGKHWFSGQLRNGGGAVPMELGAVTGSTGEWPERRECFLCGKVGHLKKGCLTKR